MKQPESGNIRSGFATPEVLGSWRPFDFCNKAILEKCPGIAPGPGPQVVPKSLKKLSMSMFAVYLDVSRVKFSTQ